MKPNNNVLTSLAVSGTITTTATAATTTIAINVTGSTTASNVMIISNTGANLTVGVDNSAGGGLMTGTLAYSSCVFNSTTTALHLGTNNLPRITIFSGGNVAVGSLTDNGAKFQVSGNTTVTQLFITGDSGSGASSTVSFTNVTTESLSSGACTIVSGGTTARVNTGWLKIYSGSNVRHIPYWTTISG